MRPLLRLPCSVAVRFLRGLTTVIGDPAALHRNDPPLHFPDCFPIVGSHDNRRALHIDVSEQAKHLLAALGIQVARRLIGKEHQGFVHQSARATATRCCSPPDNLGGVKCLLDSIPTFLSTW